VFRQNGKGASSIIEKNRKIKGYLNPYQLDLVALATNMPEPFPEGCVQIVQSLDS
jgi:hypothetical protein